MSYVLTTTYTQSTPAPGTKPVEFYGTKYPESAARIAAWTKSQPGVLYTNVFIPNWLTLEGIIVFDTMANLNAYKTARASNADIQQRDAYLQQNGTTVSETVTG